jgi:hypothetical protein
VAVDAAARAQFRFEGLLLSDNRPISGGGLILPVRDLLVAQDAESRPFEQRPVVPYRIGPDWKPGNAAVVQFECREREPPTATKEPGCLGQRFHLAGCVLEGIDSHGRVG